MLIYTIIQILIAPFLLIILFFKILSGKVKFKELKERFNDIIRTKNFSKIHGNILVHASSVGEAKISILLAELIKRRNKRKIILSISTVTGKKIAQASGLFDDIFFFPFDIPFFTEKLVKNINPFKAIIIETEIWPRLFHNLKKITDIYIINGRISEKSYNRYYKFKFFFEKYFKMIKFYFARTNLDFKRADSLGVINGDVYGNIKYNYEDKQDIKLEEKINKLKNKKIILFGSIREKEEIDIISVIRKIKNIKKNCLFIIAPRHIDRVKNIKQLLDENEINSCLFSDIEDSNVIIVDEIGILFNLYKYCYLAFIGGSLYNYGGQNPIEPAYFSKPVIFGTYMDNFIEEKNILTTRKAAIIVENSENLLNKILYLLDNPEIKENFGKSAFECYNLIKCDILKILEKMNL